jgi:hypothetical protein
MAPLNFFPENDTTNKQAEKKIVVIKNVHFIPLSYMVIYISHLSSKCDSKK